MRRIGYQYQRKESYRRVGHFEYNLNPNHFPSSVLPTSTFLTHFVCFFYLK